MTSFGTPALKWQNGIDRSEVWETEVQVCQRSRNQYSSYFQGEITNTTPRGTCLIYRLKPGASVSCKDTSERLDSAMESMHSARDRNPLISPGT